MKISVLMNNDTALAGFVTEHGLSLCIEACGRRILFDAGQSGAFAENAEKLGIDLAQIDAAVLSHGHYDHGGGLREFLKRNDHAPVYLSRWALQKHLNSAGREIGIDPGLAESDRLILTDGYVRIAEGIELYPASAVQLTVPLDTDGMKAGDTGTLAPEDFRHEQYLLVREHGKSVLFSGCSHRGILNIEHSFHPDVLIGGFHFMKIDPKQAEGRQRLEQSAAALCRNPTHYFSCHCTGGAQYDVLKKTMQDQLQHLDCGQVLEL